MPTGSPRLNSLQHVCLAVSPNYLGSERPTRMNRNEWELTVGSVLIIAAGIALFAPLVSGVSYPDLVLAVVTLVAAVGVVLVGLSRRGRTA